MFINIYIYYVIDLFCIIIFLVAFSKMLKKSLAYSYFNLLFFYQGLWSIFSLIYIETGIYITELKVDTYPVFSVPIYTFFHLTSMIVIYKTSKFFFDKVRLERYSIKQNEIAVLKFMYIGIMLLLFFNLALSPLPVLNPEMITRGEFWTQHARFPILGKVFGRVSAFLPFIAGIIFLRQKKLGIAFFLIHSFYSILLGQKFGPFIFNVWIFFLPYVYVNEPIFRFGKVRFKYILITISGISIVYLLLLNSYKNYELIFGEALGITSIEQAMFYRAFALEAELIWQSVDYYVIQGLAHTWDVGELYDGMFTLMKAEIPDLTKDEVIYTFTNGYYPILMRVFSLPVAYLLNILVMTFFPVMMTFIIFKSIKNRNFILSVLALQILFKVIDALSMGRLGNLIIPFIFVALVLFLLSTRKQPSNYNTAF